MPRMPPNSYEVIVDPGNAGKFIVGNRYKFKKKLGGGAYGVVAMFTDSETIVDDGKGNMVPMEVAVKKTTNAFQDVIDSKRTLRELKLLSHVSHDNIVRLMEVLPSACSAKEQADVYAVMERLDTDLHQIIRSPQALTDEHYQYFMYQLLCGLQYLHSCDIIHRDLKPGNLLVNKNCDLKICDFGLARIKGDVGTETEGDPLTEYVITRWYRPPELILTRSYDESIDMWSAGTIMAELLNRKPVFPGKDYVDQIKVILRTIGSPGDADKAFITNKKARDHVSGLGSFKKMPWEQKFPKAAQENPESLKLLEAMLQFNPAKRLTAADALRHPYFVEHFDGEDPAIFPCEKKFNFDFDFEGRELSATQWRDLMWEQTLKFHPELK